MTEGKKFDEGKLRMDLVDPMFVRGIASVMTYGANKYGPNSWQQLEDFEARYTAALLRHITAWQTGETHDSESGIHHLLHATANLMFLYWKDTTGDGYGFKDVRSDEGEDDSQHAGSGSGSEDGLRVDAEETLEFCGSSSKSGSVKIPL